jgi:hypothetical protein
MTAPQLYVQMFTQLRQWISPADRRHLQGVAEAVSGILQSESGCPSHWLPYLSHRDCNARSHLQRLHYLLQNPAIDAATYHQPLLQHLLQAWTGGAMTLVLDTSMFWDRYCLIEICLAWGGRSIVLAQSLLEHGSASVAFDDYCPVLETVLALLPADVQVLFLADRGFEHGELIRWLDRAHWDHNVQILGDITCHLATAHWPGAKEPWAVLTRRTPSLQTFAEYGQRFGGIEPHFKDYKSATFDLTRSHIRDPDALNCLLMLIAMAELLAILIGFSTVYLKQLSQIDWHGQRGISFLQLGLRELKRRIYARLPMPPFKPLPYANPPPASASLKKKAELADRIEFSRITVFNF